MKDVVNLTTMRTLIKLSDDCPEGNTLVDEMTPIVNYVITLRRTCHNNIRANDISISEDRTQRRIMIDSLIELLKMDIRLKMPDMIIFARTSYIKDLPAPRTQMLKHRKRFTHEFSNGYFEIFPSRLTTQPRFPAWDDTQAFSNAMSNSYGCLLFLISD